MIVGCIHHTITRIYMESVPTLSQQKTSDDWLKCEVGPSCVWRDEGLCTESDIDGFECEHSLSEFRWDPCRIVWSNTFTALVKNAQHTVLSRIYEMCWSKTAKMKLRKLCCMTTMHVCKAGSFTHGNRAGDVWWWEGALSNVQFLERKTQWLCHKISLSQELNEQQVHGCT